MFILSTPPVPAPVPVDQWESISCQWVGADGSVWDLASGAEGAVLQALGTEGMHDPVLTKFSSTSRAIPGKRLRGWRAEAREVFWPLKLYADTSNDWRDTYARFFASIHPEIPGTWRVGFRSEIRELDLTGVYEKGHAFQIHPTVLGWGTFGQELEAAQPYWRGQTQRFGPWRAPSTTDFFNGGAPDFVISEAAAFGTAEVSNPGDVETYPVFTVRNALTSVSFGAPDAVITVPFNVTAGNMLRVDTDPRNPTATLGPIPTGDAAFTGTDVTTAFGFQPFVAIAPGASRPIVAQGTGTGSIEAELTPLHFRAI